MKQHGFPKATHLKSKKLIERLFKEGEKVKGYPLLAVYTPIEPGASTHQAGFSVSKRKFKHAVDRNLLKRRMREAYRLNKHLLPGGEEPKLAIMFIYLPAKAADFMQIEKGMQKALTHLAYAHKKENT